MAKTSVSGPDSAASAPVAPPAQAPRDPTSREKILDVAEALFARRGFSGVGLREVATSVGLKKSSLFHHFPTKQALYDEVLCRVLERLERRIAPVGKASLGHTERLEGWVDAVIDGLSEHPTTARLALRSLFEEEEAGVDDPGSGTGSAAEATIVRLVEDFERLYREGVAAGAFRPTSVSHLTQTLIGATVYHFASSTFGEQLTGAPLFQAASIEKRKQEVKRLLREGIVFPERPAEGTP